MDINKVFVSGSLTRDPELFFNLSNQAVCKINIKSITNKKVNFFDVVIYGKLAVIAKEKLKKESKILLEGRLRFKSFTLKSGEKRNKVEIQADLIHFIEKGGKLNVSTEQQSKQTND